ncbi:hypothetical protein I5R28_08650 [Serratia marcescens]|uniref:ABC-three component system protein n=1 Tax=Serratia TaxID=613 RepID=UPI0018D856C8|nr:MULTISPECIES: ABC-three component system protein [Serratia]MBH3169980.1 hypothetical protein [Serratia marcescens]UMK55682.1 GPI inositol-deacylase [Serratia marcescens]
MSMIEWARKENKDSLILFIHGLKGGGETWSYNEDVSFPKLLLAESDLENDFDIACFNYFTTFTSIYGKAKGVFSWIFSSTKKIAKNLPVQEISELLITEINVTLSNYKQIIIVSHSMGGLITKDCILKKIKDGSASQITGFISLAVPHSGAMIATLPSLISPNAQLIDLSLLSDTTDTLNREWANSGSLPITKYIYGSYDSHVNKKSALPLDSDRKNSIAVDEDHTSICKPQDSSKTVYVAVKKYILEINSIAFPKLIVANLSDSSQYDNEYFVLKMIIADIHCDITLHAKEYYYNAELARNIFTSDRDRGILNNLYGKIKMIYQEEYENHIANKNTPDQFISRVHTRIGKEDKESLDTLLRNLESIHKKGMLHQLANKSSRDVIWSSTTCLDSLDEIKRG